MADRFGEDILVLIRQHYPQALQGDGEQAAQCSIELSVALGGLLAFALKFGGIEPAFRAINLMVDKM